MPASITVQSAALFAGAAMSYEFGGDPDLTEQLYEFFRANVGNTVPCEISDAMPQP